VALLLDADGLVVAGTYATADGTDLGAVIGAHLSGVSDEAERAMRHFGLGAWTRILLESEAATLMMSPAQDGVTLVAAPREVPLGFVRRTLDQCQVLARRWLGEGA
jgi:predicted regulator of Ras-like GTPase activity (Roadblock/LC7/MglB family)